MGITQNLELRGDIPVCSQSSLAVRLIFFAEFFKYLLVSRFMFSSRTSSQVPPVPDPFPKVGWGTCMANRHLTQLKYYQLPPNLPPMAN